MSQEFNYLFGRQAAIHPVGYSLINEYVDALLEAPGTFDRTGGFDGFRMLGNGPDRTLTINGGNPVGDCAFVGSVNVDIIDQLETHETLVFPTSNATVGAYLTYDHGRDLGANLNQLLAYWHRVGLPWGKNQGYAALNFRDIDEFWAGTYTFGCSYIGIVVTAAMQQQTAAGEPWDISSTEAGNQVMGGHCVVPFARTSSDGDGILATWGMRQDFTARWFRRNVEEAHVVITPAQATRNGNGLGTDYEKLEADLEIVEQQAA